MTKDVQDQGWQIVSQWEMVYDYYYSGSYLTFSQPHSYLAWAFSAISINTTTWVQLAMGRGSAGLLGGEIKVDSTLLAQLSEEGFSSDSLTGQIDVSDNGELVVNNLSGEVSIAKYSNFVSKFQNNGNKGKG